ncbi:MAG: M48 family metallopeptidase [Acidobacteria bacterium]|nr:M48 family metallopeptidase [Acidobacteriota bacterium]
MTFTSSSGPAGDTPEARRYNRIHRRLSIAELVLSFAALVALLATGWTGMLRDWALGGARSHYSLALFLYVAMLAALTKAITLGLDYYGFRLEHRFHLSNQNFAAWAWDEAKGWFLGLILGVFAAEIIYAAIRAWPDFWWLAAWCAFLVLMIFFAQIAPVVLLPIFYKFKPLEDENLKARLVALGARAGAQVRGVYEWKLSEKSRKANAALTGLGNTRRIILADTLLQNYSADEIESILAHELGHHVHKHILKGIAVQAAVTFAGFWAANQVLRYAIYQRHTFGMLSDFADLPLLVLVSSLLSLLLAPALNAWSRHNEREADLYSWQSTVSVEPFITSMSKLAEQNLAEREPSRIVEFLFHSHPPISRRIRAATEFARSRSGAGGG